MEDCNYCKYCKPKEKEQTKNKEPHMCLLINKVLRHGTQSQPHYRIIPHIECPLNTYNDY